MDKYIPPLKTDGAPTGKERAAATRIIAECKGKPIRKLGPMTKEQIAAETAAIRKSRRSKGWPE